MTEGFYAQHAFRSSLDDTWTTPKVFYDKLNDEFNFTLDAAASKLTTLVEDNWYGLDHEDTDRQDAIKCDWFGDSNGGAIWLNPPYGRTLNRWLEKAGQEASKGATVVCLVPSRTDTKWWHNYCIQHEVRFIKGRLSFGNHTNLAPFPSELVVMK